MNSNLYNRTPNKPKNISLWELVQYNYISENDIDINGKVNDTIYERALRNYISEIGDLNINRPRSIQTQYVQPNVKSISIKPGSASHINNVRLMKNAIDENRELQEKENCCMCLTNKISYIFIPCYHVCSCRICANKVNRCPKCRENIQTRHRVWF